MFIRTVRTACQAALAQTVQSSLARQPAVERIQNIVDKYGAENVVVTTSFGIQSAVLLHLISRVNPNITVAFVDTGYLFDETYDYAEQLLAQLPLNLKVYSAAMTPAWQERKFGKLWEQGLSGLQQYNHMVKVEPMQRALRELKPKVWLSGLRATQSKGRSQRSLVEPHSTGCLKVHPILDWTDEDVDEYLDLYDLPKHPLVSEGYATVGDWHSSAPLEPGMTAEQTRFGGLARECGLHTLWVEKEKEQEQLAASA
eukprot:TRINITY_DN77662_c0_g1_i1.p1 TRINITY_DN77662_c0_g1~~TRINITY_DN77662_c0_g1_i1.p1  ORF type:complete len:256 (+),score=15.61 TRINITY_DN77662_c0_g1_i1:102-869(+)